MIKFGGERFAIMSRDGEWHELKGIYTIAIENTSDGGTWCYNDFNETTITITVPTTSIQEALYKNIAMRFMKETFGNPSRGRKFTDAFIIKKG